MKRFPQLCLAVFALLLVIGLAAPAWAEGDMKGKIKSVDPDRLEFVIDDSKGNVVTFQLDEDAQIILNDREATLADLQPGDQAIVMGHQTSASMMAIEVRCRRQ
jgi:hypothetical protein